MRMLIDAILKIFAPILYVFRGIAIVIDEDLRSDPECWDHPGRKRRYRRRMRREARIKKKHIIERKKHGENYYYPRRA